MKKVLIVDDDVAITESLKFALRKKYDLYLANDFYNGLDIYINNEIDITLLDLRLGNRDGLDLYEKIKEIDRNAVVIIITAFGTIRSSKEAIRKGVFDYLTKPIDLNELYEVIEKGLEKSREYLNVKSGKKHLEEYKNLGVIANSPSMKNVLKIVEKIKNINSNILITGESGTGKTLLSKAIHKLGNRKDKEFYSINCAAIPSELLESELFGYKKGAFTGADKDKKGYLELCDGGTLLLDEIGEMDINLQTKLLKVIQEKSFIPLGGQKQKTVDVRIIAATNADLNTLVKEKRFREDLYYRINVINIKVPPLRERKEDIEALVKFFVEKYSKIMDRKIDAVAGEFIDELKRMELKGNIRELENIVESSIALSDGKSLKKEDILLLDSRKNTNVEKDRKIIPVFIGESLETIEKRVILANYEFYERNQKITSDKLGITDRTIRNKLKRYRDEENNS